MAKIEATQKLDAEGQPTGKKSAAKIAGIVLCGVGILIILLSGLSEFAHAIGVIPGAFEIKSGVTWGGVACALGAIIYGGEIMNVVDKLPKLGG